MLLTVTANSRPFPRQIYDTKVFFLSHQEEELRQSGEAKYHHLNEDLHVLIEVFAPPAEAYARMGHALEEIKKFLIPVCSLPSSHTHTFCSWISFQELFVPGLTHFQPVHSEERNRRDNFPLHSLSVTCTVILSGQECVCADSMCVILSGKSWV